MTQGLDLLREAVRSFEARDRDRTAELLRQLVAEAPPIGGNWGPASRLAATIGEVDTAVAAARQAVVESPDDVDRRLDYGATVATVGRVEDALTATAWFIPHAAPDARLEFQAGTLNAQLGRTAEALQHFRRVLQLPGFPQLFGATWLAIADLKTFGNPDFDLNAMEALRARLGGEGPSTLLYALAKAYDDRGETSKAFELYRAGARKVRAERSFDAAGSRAFVDEMVGGYTDAFVAGLPTSEADSDRPIFVLGLPRSGTTLVEQILASHSAVAGVGEANLFRTASMALGGYAPAQIAAYAAEAGPGAFTRIGQAYLDLLAQREPGAARVVDKTLNNTRFVGLIRQALPGARFVWVRRDPGDTALSCFRSHFAEGLGWSFDLADIGRQFADEDRLYAHWTALFPDAILTVPYEGLVAEPESWTRRILEHVGLAFEPGVLEFHKTQRAVTTTSARQVREPLYSRAVGGWRRYEAFMGPFFEAYRAG